MTRATRRPRRRKWSHKKWSVVAVAVSVVALSVAVVKLQLVTGSHGGSPCAVTIGSVSYRLDLEQAAQATTIAGVGKRLQLPDHAVTVALATALQESRLHNLDYGDLDSLGLFQQRPSQGWGSPSEIMVPRLAAAAFYGRLAQVSGWQTMSVTDAAQAVQHSAAPDAYAQWEPEARLLARALTGEAPAGLSCRFASPTAGPDTTVVAAMAGELGPPAIGSSVSPARGWTMASWLVGHAHQYRISSIVFGGFRWTAGQGTWTAVPGTAPDAASRVQVAGVPIGATGSVPTA